MRVLKGSNLDRMRESLPPEFRVEDAMEWLAPMYHAPLKAVHALERSGEIIRLKRGLYAFSEGLDRLALAHSLHGPSYISFETALEFHGLIPERVNIVMSVVDGRPATFNTPVGVYEYHSQARGLFARGMGLQFFNGRTCPMANPEKALLDSLSRAKLRAADLSEEDILSFTEESLRVSRDALGSLSCKKLLAMAPLYRNLAPTRLAQALASRKAAGQ